MACPHATAHSWSSSFSQDSWEAIIDSSAHKVTELSRCLPLSPPSMCPNFPVPLCVWMSGKAQIRHRNSCSGGLLACIHTSTHARTQKSVREAAAGTHPPKRLNTPTDARHYTKLPRPQILQYTRLIGPSC